MGLKVKNKTTTTISCVRYNFVRIDRDICTSRTVGVPIVGVEYYIGRIDVVSKILQIIAIALSGFAIYGVQKLRIVKKISR